LDPQFSEFEQAPLPPEQVRVTSARASPYPDRRRVKVGVCLTPFLERPDVELRIADPGGETLAEAAVIECVEHEFELTLHLRQPSLTAMACHLQVKVSYPERDPASAFVVEFTLPAPAS
jgi:hypothetical protein